MLGIKVEAVHGMADIPHTCAAADDTTCLLTSMLHTLYGRCGCSMDLHSTSGVVYRLTLANKHSPESGQSDLLYTRTLKAAIASKSCAEAAAGPVSSLHWVGASTAITAVAPAGRATEDLSQ